MPYVLHVLKYTNKKHWNIFSPEHLDVSALPANANVHAEHAESVVMPRLLPQQNATQSLLTSLRKWACSSCRKINCRCNKLAFFPSGNLLSLWKFDNVYAHSTISVNLFYWLIFNIYLSLCTFLVSLLHWLAQFKSVFTRTRTDCLHRHHHHHPRSQWTESWRHGNGAEIQNHGANSPEKCLCVCVWLDGSVVVRDRLLWPPPCLGTHHTTPLNCPPAALRATPFAIPSAELMRNYLLFFHFMSSSAVRCANLRCASLSHDIRFIVRFGDGIVFLCVLGWLSCLFIFTCPQIERPGKKECYRTIECCALIARMAFRPRRAHSINALIEQRLQKDTTLEVIKTLTFDRRRVAMYESEYDPRI